MGSAGSWEMSTPWGTFHEVLKCRLKINQNFSSLGSLFRDFSPIMGKRLSSNFRINIFLVNLYQFFLFSFKLTNPFHLTGYIYKQEYLLSKQMETFPSKAGVLPHLVDVVSLKHSWPLLISVFLVFFSPIPAGFEALEHQGDAVTSLSLCSTSPSFTSSRCLPCTNLPVLFWGSRCFFPRSQLGRWLKSCQDKCSGGVTLA